MSLKGHTLLELCRYLNVSLQSFTLSCTFCNSVLDAIDKANFAASQLKVVVRDFAFKGACITCRRELAAQEKRRYLVCVGEADLVEAMTGTGIVHCTVRCLNCLALLSASEKLVAKGCCQPFYLVRHFWRAQCRNCRTPGC